MITEAKLLAFSPGLKNAKAIAASLASACTLFDINTSERVCMFMANCAHESAGFTKPEESLNYSVKGLIDGFGRHRISEADAKALGRAPGRPANQRAIADRIYGGAWGKKNLGNNRMGDGSLYIGRGWIGITGLSNYKAFSQYAFGDDRLIRHPGEVATGSLASMVAGWYWNMRKLNAYADKSDLKSIRAIINTGSPKGEPKGLPETETWYRKAKRIWP